MTPLAGRDRIVLKWVGEEVQGLARPSAPTNTPYEDWHRHKKAPFAGGSRGWLALAVWLLCLSSVVCLCGWRKMWEPIFATQERPRPQTRPRVFLPQKGPRWVVSGFFFTPTIKFLWAYRESALFSWRKKKNNKQKHQRKQCPWFSMNKNCWYRKFGRTISHTIGLTFLKRHLEL